MLDALGGGLQALARFPLETESLDAERAKAQITEWMRHATMGARHPSRGVDVGGRVAARDWRGLVHSVGKHRLSEQVHTQKGMCDLRETVWSIVASAHRVATADASRPVSDQLERVRLAVESETIATVRREALAAEEAVSSLLERQRENQRREFAALADRIRALGTQLEDARRESVIDPLTRLANRKGFEECLDRPLRCTRCQVSPRRS